MSALPVPSFLSEVLADEVAFVDVVQTVSPRDRAWA